MAERSARGPPTAMALGRIGDGEAAGPLLASYSSKMDPFLRHAIIYALYEIGDMRSLPTGHPFVKQVLQMREIDQQNFEPDAFPEIQIAKVEEPNPDKLARQKQRLNELAAFLPKGEMRQPDVLKSETLRLLNNDPSNALVERFSEAWLRLDKLGSMPPSQTQFPTYYYYRLEAAMQTETRLFFADVLKRNRPVTDFLTARDTFVNDALAKHYGLSGITGEEFQHVTLPADIRRSGILGHASVLTASANGVETSPVVRGVFVLESILGTPPPDVPPIEPDTRGATTIREQLAKHRNVAACANCHSKIDPWGFALEFYDPIGGFRTHYPVFTGGGRIAARTQGKAIDGSGELATGEIIQDEAGLTQALLSREEQFTRNLTTKLLTHATGREMTYGDQKEIERIVQQSSGNGGGFRDLLLLVMSSSAFQKR